MKKNKNGFTLFELLISISIIGILVAVVSSNFSAAQKKARDARRMEDLNSIQKAAEQYYSVNSYTYPTKVQFTDSGILQFWPKDPKTNDDYNYQLNVPATGRYCVCAGLESATGNSTSHLCGNFVSGTGTSQCVISQQ